MIHTNKETNQSQTTETKSGKEDDDLKYPKREIFLVVVLARNRLHLLHRIPSSSEICYRFEDVMGCLVEINKTHKPEFMAICGGDLNVLLRRILFRHHRVHGAYISQRYRHLVVTPSCLSRRRSKSQRTIAAKSQSSSRQILSPGNRPRRRRKITGKRLLQFLVLVSRENLLKQQLESAFG